MVVPKKETTDFVVGKGSLYFQEGEVFTGKFRDLGEIPEANLTIETEVLEYVSSKSGNKTVIKRRITQTKVNGTIKLSDINVNNLNLYFLGGTIGETNQAADTDVEKTISAVSLDLWEETGYVNLSNVVVKNSGGTITYVLNTDYEIEEKSGMFRALTGGSIVDASDVKLTFDCAETKLYTIGGGEDPVKKGHIAFKANPSEGRIQDFAGYVEIQPTGDLQKIGDEWQSISLNVAFVSHSKYRPSLIKIVDRGVAAS